MNQVFADGSDDRELFETVTHLEIAAKGLGMDTAGLMFGLTEAAGKDVLQMMQDVLNAAMDKKKSRLAWQNLPICHIGPYADGTCTICGLRQPDY